MGPCELRCPSLSGWSSGRAAVLVVVLKVKQYCIERRLLSILGHATLGEATRGLHVGRRGCQSAGNCDTTIAHSETDSEATMLHVLAFHGHSTVFASCLCMWDHLWLCRVWSRL